MVLNSSTVLLLLEKTYQRCRLHKSFLKFVTLTLGSAQDTTSRTPPTRQPRQLINQRPHITLSAVAGADLHAHQVPWPSFWCGRTPHANRLVCPALKGVCHGCGKRGNWKQICTRPVRSRWQPWRINWHPWRCNRQPRYSMLASTWVPRHHHQGTSISISVKWLDHLTHVNKESLWAHQHSEAFTKAKELVAKAPCLSYFDVYASVVLPVHAS